MKCWSVAEARVLADRGHRSNTAAAVKAATARRSGRVFSAPCVDDSFRAPSETTSSTDTFRSTQARSRISALTAPTEPIVRVI